MKKIIFVLGVVASLILAGCASQTADQNSVPQTTTAKAPAHHPDYKGETK